MEKITRILLLTHGEFGSQLLTSATMIFGRVDDVVALPLLEGASLDEYSKKLKEICEEAEEDVLALADLHGGTPENRLILLLCEQENLRKKVHSVSGVNLPMLLEALSLRADMHGAALADAVVEAGRFGIFDNRELISEMPKKQGGES